MKPKTPTVISKRSNIARKMAYWKNKKKRYEQRFRYVTTLRDVNRRLFNHVTTLTAANKQVFSLSAPTHPANPIINVTVPEKNKIK